jgi:hypothetical protein
MVKKVIMIFELWERRGCMHSGGEGVTAICRPCPLYGTLAWAREMGRCCPSGQISPPLARAVAWLTTRGRSCQLDEGGQWCSGL